MPYACVASHFILIATASSFGQSAPVQPSGAENENSAPFRLSAVAASHGSADQRGLDSISEADAREPRPLGPEPTPFTIEPGRLAVEVDLLNFAYDRHNQERTSERVRALEWPLLLRYGVTEALEIQFGAELYVRETVRDREQGERTRTHGFGDLILGAKYNLWGNDGGKTALALNPYLRLPTNRHGLTSRAVQGGLLVPFAAELPAEFYLEWTPGFSAIRRSDDDG